MNKLIFAAIAACAVASPALAQNGDFSGPRVEAVFGWDHTNKITGKAVDGVVYGGAVGYDWQRGKMVFGVEGEITSSTVEDEGIWSLGTSYKGTIGRDLYVGGRIGRTVGADTLIYAKGGYTNVGGHFTLESPTQNFVGDGSEGGWRVGAGAEIKLTAKTYLKNEYRYSDYGPARHQVVTGLGFRF